MPDIKDQLVPIETSSPTHVIAPLPPSQDTTPDQIAYFNRPNSIPFIRHSPLPAAANAAIGATAAATAQQVINNNIENIINQAAGSGSSEITLTMPPQYSVTGSPGDDLDVAWIPEAAGTFLRAGIPNLSSLESLSQAALATNGVATSTVTVTGAPTSATSWGLYVASNMNSGNFPALPSGWTQQFGIFGTFTKSLTGISPISLVQNIPVNSACATVLAIFAGAFPTIVQSVATSWGFSSPQSVAFTSSNTAGNALLIIARSTLPNPAFSLAAVDTNNNNYIQLANVSVGGVWSPTVLIMLCPSCVAGSNTVNFTVGGTPAGGENADFEIFELSPLASGPGLPFFGPITQADIPLSPTVTLFGSAVPVGANQVNLGSSTATTVGSAGAASALPANPTGYLIINVAGTNRKIPYYDV